MCVAARGGQLAIGLSCFASGITASYLALRRMKDGEVLLEWTDEVDELEERAAAKAVVPASEEEKKE